MTCVPPGTTGGEGGGFRLAQPGKGCLGRVPIWTGQPARLTRARSSVLKSHSTRARTWRSRHPVPPTSLVPGRCPRVPFHMELHAERDALGSAACLPSDRPRQSVAPCGGAGPRPRVQGQRPCRPPALQGLVSLPAGREHPASGLPPTLGTAEETKGLGRPRLNHDPSPCLTPCVWGFRRLLRTQPCPPILPPPGQLQPGRVTLRPCDAQNEHASPSNDEGL